jgi:aspartate-semialdehyde dehydrogenase
MSAAPGRDLKLAIVGATGTVGARLVELIDERRFPYAELKLFASADSAPQRVEVGGDELPVDAFTSPGDLAGFDVAFLALPEHSAAEIIKSVSAASSGPLLIDLSPAARSISRAPLVAPGLTPREEIARLAAGGIFALPHPVAYVLATLLKALDARAEFVAATAILGASHGGRERLASLITQSANLMNAQLNVGEGEIQLAFNVFVDPREAQTAAELGRQAASLLGYKPSLALLIAQAPTLHGTALALSARLDCDLARRKLREAPGVLLVEDEGPQFRGVVDAVGEDAILVRVLERPPGVALWCLFDSARLAVLPALWIAENLRPGSGSTLA